MPTFLALKNFINGKEMGVFSLQGIYKLHIKYKAVATVHNTYNFGVTGSTKMLHEVS